MNRVNNNMPENKRTQTQYLRSSHVDRKLDRYMHDPIRLETGTAADNIANISVRAVRLG